MAANGISAQDGTTGWASMLMMLLKVALNVERLFKVADCICWFHQNSRWEGLATSKLGCDVTGIDY